MSRAERSQTRKDPDEARFAYSGLDRLIHERSRLSILTSLAAHPKGLVFNDLKSLCALTDGNLSRQLQLLGDARLVESARNPVRGSKRPQTHVRLTSLGRRRFAQYLAVLESVITDAGAEQTSNAGPSTALPRVATT
jgi:DNA-binding MarR family transcriptional regulator